MPMFKLSVVIPCYNEAENLPRLLSVCKNICQKYPECQIVLVNNGSTDNSEEILRQIPAETPNIKTVLIKNNIGYGNGILCGLKQADGSNLSWTHADLQTDPEDVCKAFLKYEGELKTGNCIVKGKRYNRPWLDFFFTLGMSIIATLLLGVRLHDINAQPKILPRSFLPNLMKDAPLDFSLDTWLLYLARKNNLAILTFPVYYGKRTAGSAKGGGSFKGKWKLTMRTLSFLSELKKRKDFE